MSLIDTNRNVIFNKGLRLGDTNIKGNETEIEDENSSNTMYGLIRYNKDNHKFQGLHHKDGVDKFNNTWQDFGVDMASKNQLGGVKIGNNLNIDNKTGVLSAVNTSTSKIYQRIITVSPIPNQADYTSINDAIFYCLGTPENNYKDGIFTDNTNDNFLGELSFDCVYTIILSPGVYEEIITIPDYINLMCETPYTAIIKFPKHNINEHLNKTHHMFSHINYLITLNNNVNIKNIKIVIDSITKDNKYVGIYGENKSNIILDNVLITDYENKNENTIIGIHLYGGYNNLIKYSYIKLNLGCGDIYGIYLNNTECVINHTNLYLNSICKNNYGIFIEKSDTVLIEYSSINITNSNNSFGVYIDKSNLNLKFISILINGNCFESDTQTISDNLYHSSYGIYSVDKSNREKFALLELELELNHQDYKYKLAGNKLYFDREDDIDSYIHSDIDSDIYNDIDSDIYDNVFNSKLINSYETNSVFNASFIDLGFKEGNMINIDKTNKNYKILKVDENELILDIYKINECVIDNISIKYIFNINIFNSIISIVKNTTTNTTTAPLKNSTCCVDNTDIYNIIMKNTSMEGGEPIYSNSCVINNMVNHINVSNYSKHIDNILKVSTALNILKTNNIKSDHQTTTGYYINIDEGDYNETILSSYEHFNLIENLEIKGCGIDKTILNINTNIYDYESTYKHIFNLESNVKIANLTINFIFKTTSHNIHSPHNNDISLFYGVGVNNVLFDTVKINLMYSNDIAMDLNVFNFKNSEYKFTKGNINYNCGYALDSIQVFSNTYCFSKLQDIDFNINQTICNTNKKNNCVIYCKNSFIDINNCNFNKWEIDYNLQGTPSDNTSAKCNINGIYLENDTNDYISKINDSYFNFDNVIIYQNHNVSLIINNCIFNNGELKCLDRKNMNCHNSYYLIGKDNINYILLNNYAELETKYKNTLVGYNKTINLKKAANNTLIGYNSGKQLCDGSNNTLVGTNTAINIINGNDNICIGTNSGILLSNKSSNNMIIGNYNNSSIDELVIEHTNNITNNNIIIGDNIVNIRGSNNIILSNKEHCSKTIQHINNKLVISGNTANINNKSLICGDLENNILYINRNVDNDLDLDLDLDLDNDLDNSIKLNVDGRIKCDGIINTNIYSIGLKIKDNDDTLKNGMVLSKYDKDTVRISTVIKDTSIYGIYNSKHIIINGECNILYCNNNNNNNNNGDINIGDYITTSHISGYCIKQDDNIRHSYTVGKCIEKIDWNINNNKTINILNLNGKKIKTCLLLCKLLC